MLHAEKRTRNAFLLFCFILFSENEYSYFYSSTEEYETGVEFCSQMLHI